MIYNIGDKVIVRNDLASGTCYDGVDVTKKMERFRGKVVTIQGFCPYGKDRIYVVKDNDWLWTGSMFEPPCKSHFTREVAFR